MVASCILTGIASLVLTASAWDASNYGGFGRIWQETFAGPVGTSPNRGNWNIIDGNLGVNEWQTYTSQVRNVRLSGGSTLQIVPWRDGSQARGWMSVRLESTHLVTPAPRKLTRVESAPRFGSNPVERKQGIWPAFWMVGQAINQGVVWPACGEIDIIEHINGRPTGYGTIHCHVFPGGICNEGNGIGGSTGVPDNNWHKWRVEIDRRPGNWLDQSISWYMDDWLFHQVRGHRINNHEVWASLCYKPFYIILNLAVGGNWPGAPNGNTWDGFGSIFEVAYVAHYSI